jgi:hypothetical protein
MAPNSNHLIQISIVEEYRIFSIYFIIKYIIELIFDNTSIIEYWFFRMLNILSPELHPR